MTAVANERAMAAFGAVTRQWFERAFATPTRVQALGWASIAAGRHSLLIAPTGSGKTLAAFLWCIDRLSRAPRDAARPGVRTVYVSPLKALVYDIDRNLRVPLAGIADAAEQEHAPISIPRVAMRTGDTTSVERQRMKREPPEILITTPESLYLMLTSDAREVLTTVDTVIVDEVHALAANKRGAHLALSLERLAARCGRDPQRIGLSATATPLEQVARFLGGDREVTIVDASTKPAIDVQIVVPVADMTRPDAGDGAPAGADAPPPPNERPRKARKPRADAVPRSPAGTFETIDSGLWAAIYPRLVELILAHRSTIIFVNSRGLCERLAQRLAEHARDPELVRAHHGSVARERREQIEEQLKHGRIRAIVATSSLELGIDMGAVDLVVLVESPGSVARGLQRIGRAGHGVGETSRGRVFPKHRGDLLECAVVCERMRDGLIEPIAYLRNPLDVLAQHVVSMCAMDPWTVGDVARLVRRVANYRDLPEDALTGVLDMLSGRYPSHAFADLRPRVVWDRETDTLTARRGAKQIAIWNGGTIPDRGTYGVYHGEDGPRVGELDEEMVHESAPGQNVMLGASTWRIVQITRDRVIVTPAPGESGRLPFWRGDGPGRPFPLGQAIGAFVARVADMSRDDALAWLQSAWGLDAWAASNLVQYLYEQREHTGTLPTDRSITIERFRDELGDLRICILSDLGARVHAPWALAIQARLAATYGFDVDVLWNDDGIVLRLVEIEQLPGLDVLVPDPDEVEEQVTLQLAGSALFAGQFRENAARSLLMPRARAAGRTPLWQQRQKAQQLLAVAREFPSFPIVIETYRACLQDVFDLPALMSVLSAIRRRELRVDEVETPSPSPFARSLMFAYTAAYLYEGDAPLAERKAQALALDRKLLRELLGTEEIDTLLDREVTDEIEAELQCLLSEDAVRHEDALHDLLRRLGDLEADEIALRCEGPAHEWLATLQAAHRVIPIALAGRKRFVAIEDAGLYRDAFGIDVPACVPEAFRTAVPHAFATVIERYARTHGPFTTDAIVHRHAVPEARVHAELTALEAAGKLVSGTFGSDHGQVAWCHPDVLRRIKRRTLARLRNEIEPVPARTLARFLPAWHGIGSDRIGTARLEQVIVQLEGLPLPYDELERVILPARVPGFAPRMLDELGAMGFLVWVGHGLVGKGEGRVALYRREHVGVLLDPPAVTGELSPLEHVLLQHLQTRGASFFNELVNAAGRDANVRDVREVLWDLAWRGLVTNDTFAALRFHAVPLQPRRGTRAPALASATGGRWSLVADMVRADVSPTERAFARALVLLERHGLVSRECAALEPMPGGFAAIYPVLRELEDSGKIRRGYFVQSLSGAQFASPGAVDRLRSLRDDAQGKAETREVVVLSAIDPANPYGWLLPWPVRDEQSSPRRVAGASVVLVDGEATLYLDRGGKRMLTFPAADDHDTALAAMRALEQVAARRRGKVLRIEQIDGAPARTSPHAERLRAASFRSDPGGLLLEAGAGGNARKG